MEKRSVLGTLRFVFFTILALVLIFSAVLVTVLNTYKPTVKAYIGDKFVGYFSSEQQFDEVYNDLVAEKQNVDSDVKVYLDSEPTFETSYTRDSLIAKQNVYTNLRAEMNVAPSRKALVYIVSENENVRNIFANGKVFFATLGYASEVVIQSDKSGIPEDAVSTVIPDAVIYIPFAELVDIDKEIERLKKEEDKLHKEISRCNGMLNNEKFTSKAPQAKIDEEKAKLEKYSNMLAQVEERLATLSK